MRWLFLALALLAACPAAAAEPRPFAQGSWQALRQLHRGHPTVIHFWGITCAPCMVEMPRWAELAKTDPWLDLVVASLRVRVAEIRGEPRA